MRVANFNPCYLPCTASKAFTEVSSLPSFPQCPGWKVRSCACDNQFKTMSGLVWLLLPPQLSVLVL